MKEQITELKKEIGGEAKFKFELDNVANFLMVDGNRRQSNRFWCRGVEWFLDAECKVFGNLKQLGVFLHCCNGDLGKWSIKTRFELILFNNLPEKQNFTRPIDYTFEKRTGYGLTFFLSHSELMDERNGYIKDDKIVLGVVLKAGPVNKNW